MSMCDFAEHLPFHHNLCGRGRDCVLSVREQGEGAGMAVQEGAAGERQREEASAGVNVKANGSLVGSAGPRKACR